MNLMNFLEFFNFKKWPKGHIYPWMNLIPHIYVGQIIPPPWPKGHIYLWMNLIPHINVGPIDKGAHKVVSPFTNR
jgi:hypothetical protein